MKIIAGRFKGQNLQSFKNKNIRPTMSKVKETVFNKIQFQIDGARVLDLFAGTGSLGLEALSRGAAFVDFVEKHPSSLKILKENIKIVKTEDQVNIFKEDVFSFLDKKHSTYLWDIILIDPPFTQKLANDVMLKIATLPFSKDEAMIIIESTKHEIIKDSYMDWHLKDQKNFGDKKLSFFSKIL
ncbi:MAG: 16S rRNA (guanine(966)-N(2))-methyltransferase RsmD [Bdellovibrionaceae bacterium]|nr:16S rRNA (guanine(966)-N(2))-methyltransferase RsmD [Pseudobdellovibrionaceae bacterium]